MQKNEEFFRFAMFGEYERGMVYSRKLEFLALPTNIKKVAALLLSMAYRTGHFRGWRHHHTHSHDPRTHRQNHLLGPGERIPGSIQTGKTRTDPPAKQ